MTTTATEPRTELVLLEPKERGQLDADRAALLADVHAGLPEDEGEIETAAEYAAVAALEGRIGEFLSKAEPLFDQHCHGAYRVWKSACEIRSLFLDRPKHLKAHARALLGRFVEREAQERRAREQEIAERERQEEIARNQREARFLEAEGQPEIAAAVRAAPVGGRAVALPSAVPDTPGLTYREDWYWEPVGGDTPVNRMRSLAMLVKADWLQLVTFNDAGLNAFAKRTKGTIRVPGILFRSRKVPVRR